jgi:hypothetical protein
MAFKFKRTVPEKQVSVSLSAREWEVVRKLVYARNSSALHDIYAQLDKAATTAPWLSDFDGIQEYLGTHPTEDVEVKVGDEVLYNGAWLPVVALSRNGEEAVVDLGEVGMYVLAQDDVEDHRPAHRTEAPQPVPSTYVPKVGDRVRATSTANYVPQEVVGKVGVVSALSGCGRILVRYEGRPDCWWLKDFEPAQIEGKSYVYATSGACPRLCTLIRNENDVIPLVKFDDNGATTYVSDKHLTPA